MVMFTLWVENRESGTVTTFFYVYDTLVALKSLYFWKLGIKNGLKIMEYESWTSILVKCVFFDEGDNFWR